MSNERSRSCCSSSPICDRSIEVSRPWESHHDRREIPSRREPYSRWVNLKSRFEDSRGRGLVADRPVHLLSGCRRKTAFLEQEPSESTKIVKNPAGSAHMEFELLCTDRAIRSASKRREGEES